MVIMVEQTLSLDNSSFSGNIARCAVCNKTIDAKWLRQNNQVAAVKIRYALCQEHHAREGRLMTAVFQCMRLMERACKISKLINFFSDEASAKKMFESPQSEVRKVHRGAKDPFKEVRLLYKGKEVLTVDDVERWIDNSLLFVDENGAVVSPEQQLMRELKFKEEYVHAPREIANKSKARTQSQNSRKNYSLAKLRNKWD
jgi:hypothetical protein